MWKVNLTLENIEGQKFQINRNLATLQTDRAYATEEMDIYQTHPFLAVQVFEPQKSQFCVQVKGIFQNY